MGMDNIFMHDAVPTWSGFLYQGRIAVYLAVRKINELREAGNESEIKKYALEMEKCEDIAVVYMDGNNKKYHSIHQVKNEKGCKLTSYKDPLIQLMLRVFTFIQVKMLKIFSLLIHLKIIKIFYIV